MRFQLDLSPLDIAKIAKEKGWTYYAGDVTAQRVYSMMEYAIESVFENPEQRFDSIGRIVAYRHPEMPGSIELALVIGSVDRLEEKGIEGEMNK